MSALLLGSLLGASSLAAPFVVLESELAPPAQALAPGWTLFLGSGQAVYPEGPQDEAILRAWLPLVRHPDGWAVGLAGEHAWSTAPGRGNFAQGLALSLMRAHGPLWSQLGLGAGRFRFRLAGHESETTPAGLAFGSVALQAGPLHFAVEVNAYQGAGWAYQGGQQVIYPARFGAFWLGGFGW